MSWRTSCHVKSLFPTTSPRRFNSWESHLLTQSPALSKTPSKASIPLFLTPSKRAPKSQTPVESPIRQSDPLNSPVHLTIQSYSKVAQRTPARPPEQLGSPAGWGAVDPTKAEIDSDSDDPLTYTGQVTHPICRSWYWWYPTQSRQSGSCSPPSPPWAWSRSQLLLLPPILFSAITPLLIIKKNVFTNIAHFLPLNIKKYNYNHI